MQEIFAAGKSPIHRLDPRCRVIVAVFFSTWVAVADCFTPLLLALALVTGLVIMAQLPFRDLLGRLAAIWLFLLLLWLVLPFTMPGTQWFRIGPLAVTQQGMRMAALITLKTHVILLFFLSLVATLDFITLGHVLHRFRTPAKMIHLLLLTYRYLFVIQQEYRRLVRAAKVRGFKPATNLHTYRTYAYLIGMLFIRAEARAQRVFQAMRCRGFSGQYVCLRRFSIRPVDRLWTLAMMLAGVMLIWLEAARWYP